MSSQIQAEQVEPQIISKPAFTVVGLLIHTRPMTPDIPQLWEQFVPRIGEIQHGLEPGVSYGLMGRYDQETGIFDYLAGNPVEKMDNLPAGMTHWDVPANSYAVFKSTLSTLSDTMHYIYGTWLPGSNFQQASGPNFERYGETFSPTNPIVSIYIPVEKKS